MGDEHKSQLNPYDFLFHERVAKRFADINIDLLKGRHIEPLELQNHALLDEFFPEFKEYYNTLYGLILRREKRDGIVYFYLDFPEEGRGKMNNSYRFKELSEDQTIIGIILLNMYYMRLFEYPKEIRWDDIKREIEQGELRRYYRILLFGIDREQYTDAEWETAVEKFRRALKSFDQLGWVTRLSSGMEEIYFRINVSINRLGELYKEEIENIDQLAELISQRRDS